MLNPTCYRYFQRLFFLDQFWYNLLFLHKFASSYVIFKIYINESNLKLDDINVMLGHSLGEYTALACSNKISLKECSLILKKRGELMNNAVKPNETGMAALIGKDANFVQKIIDENKLDVEIANDNSPMQIVISGLKEDILKYKDIFLSNNVKKYVELNVSAAFHSKFMNNAQLNYEKIEELNFLENDIKIIPNLDANPHNDNVVIKKTYKSKWQIGLIGLKVLKILNLWKKKIF